MAFSDCYTSLESFLKTKWRIMRPPKTSTISYEIRPISNAIGYAKFFSRSHDAVIRVYDEAGNVIEPHEHAGDFREP